MRYDTSHISTPLPQFTRRTTYSALQRSNGWAVERTIWFIDRDGDDDAQSDDISIWPTEAQALAEIAAGWSVPEAMRRAA